jgi:hypothetical protein
MRMLTIFLPLLACGLAMAGPLEDKLVARIAEANPARVLFVGNSYSFQVPKKFGEVATREGREVVVEQLTKGGWTLAKHSKAEATLKKIREGKWDVVVLQEQSQTPAIGRRQREQGMIPAAKLLAEEVRKAGAIPVFFVTWGRRDGDKQNARVFPDDTMEAMQARLLTGYREAAETAGGVAMVPVGPAWQRAKKEGLLDGLFSKDGSHPAADGIYLSACVFYTILYNTPVRKAPAAKRKLALVAGPQ